MRVVVLWADERSPNLGVRVLAAGAAEVAREVWPGCELVFQDFRRGDTGVAFDRRTILSDMRRRHGPVESVLAGADVVLDTGAGDSFTDSYGRGRLLMLTHVRRRAAAMRLPVVLLPQTYGPFRRSGSAALGRGGLAGVVMAFSRDPVSTRVAAVSLGLAPFESTDVVFGLPPAQERRRHDVLLNVSGLLWNGAMGDPRPYRAAIVAVARALRGRGREVSLLAHVLDNTGVDNDVVAMGEVSRMIGADLERLVPGSLDEARQEVAGARLVVASRMHACLNALSTSTPAIALSYSRKFAPLLRAIGWHHVVEIDAANVVRDVVAASELAGLEAAARRAAERGRELHALLRERLATVEVVR